MTHAQYPHLFTPLDLGFTTLKNRAPHLRALLQNSANHGGDGSSRYYVFDDGREATFAENIAHTASLAAGLSERYGIGHGPTNDFGRMCLLGHRMSEAGAIIVQSESLV